MTCTGAAAGRAVVLIPEMPGLTPEVLALGNHLVDNGFTVASPSLYGTPGAAAQRPGMVPVMVQGCVTKRIRGVRHRQEAPGHVLPARAGARSQRIDPGKGVGIIGQCWSGGFALAAAVDDVVLAPVLSQPSLPIGCDGGAAP
jgi:dienelactone hydrolase